MSAYFFFFNDTATTEIYTLSLHDALPIWRMGTRLARLEREAANHNATMSTQMTERFSAPGATLVKLFGRPAHERSEEHTSELQSRQYLVCRLLLEKKKKKNKKYLTI